MTFRVYGKSTNNNKPSLKLKPPSSVSQNHHVISFIL
jgi:hypothetical protein